MANKKRKSIKELREAATFAGKLLQDRGITSVENILENIAKVSTAPILPGVPSPYLPQRWTITEAQLAMIGFVKKWLQDTNVKRAQQKSSDEFFKFVIRRLEKRVRKAELEADEKKKELDKAQFFKDIEDKELKQLSDIMSPLTRLSTVKALHKFYIDSFVVFVINNAGGSTADFVEWFSEWTTQLYKLWPENKTNN